MMAMVAIRYGMWSFMMQPAGLTGLCWRENHSIAWILFYLLCPEMKVFSALGVQLVDGFVDRILYLFG